MKQTKSSRDNNGSVRRLFQGSKKHRRIEKEGTIVEGQ